MREISNIVNLMRFEIHIAVILISKKKNESVGRLAGADVKGT